MEFKKQEEAVGWIDLVQNKDNQRAIDSTVMNITFP